MNPDKMSMGVVFGFKSLHRHEYKTGRSNQLVTCYCGKWKWLDGVDAIVEITNKSEVK